MSKLKKWFWVAIVGTVLMIWIPVSKIKEGLQGFGSDSTEVVTITDQSRVVDSLNNVIAIYKEDHEELTKSVNQLNKQIADLRSAISNRETVIKNLKQGTNEKVSNVNTFTNSDIYKLLSERYKDSTTVK